MGNGMGGESIYGTPLLTFCWLRRTTCSQRGSCVESQCFGTTRCLPCPAFWECAQCPLSLTLLAHPPYKDLKMSKALFEYRYFLKA